MTLSARCAPVPNPAPVRRVLRYPPLFLGLLATGAALTACAQPPQPGRFATTATVQASPASSAPPRVIVHKSPTCGCCGKWIDHMRSAGFDVETYDKDDMLSIKTRFGIPADKGSCHTAEVDGYVIEGHVPAEDVKRLLATRPQARGLALPGMPAGSPGMEMPAGGTQPYVVELIEDGGGTRPFARH